MFKRAETAQRTRETLTMIQKIEGEGHGCGRSHHDPNRFNFSIKNEAALGNYIWRASTQCGVEGKLTFTATQGRVPGNNVRYVALRGVIGNVKQRNRVFPFL